MNNIKKTLIAIIAIFTILLNVTTAEARTFYYHPRNVFDFVKSKGYEFVELGYEDRHADYGPKDYIMIGKKIKSTSSDGELRGAAHAYDLIKKVSESSTFRKAFNKDSNALAAYFRENNIYYTNYQEAFIESFLEYCDLDPDFKQKCPNIYSWLENYVIKIFNDVTPSSWYWSYVNKSHSLGLMTGATETLFKPNANMNRAMVATVLYRMSGSPKTSYKKYFNDVPKGQYFSIPVTWAKKNGVINGYTDGTFKPTKNVTREEMATMIYNYAKYTGVDVSKGKSIASFKDSNKVSSYAKNPMKWAYKNNIITGKDNGTRLDPKGTATRAECAKMLVQAYNIL